MTNAKHSPLPWQDKFDGDIFSGKNCIACCSSEYEILDRANAALIVRAVNAMPAFEQLLEAVERSLRFQKTDCFGEHPTVLTLAKTLAAAKEALK